MSFRWAQQLHERLTALARSEEPERRGVLREAWPLMQTVMMSQCRRQVTKLGKIDAEDLRDLAAEKTLDLLRRIVSGHWDVSRHSAPELASFLATTARNALVDHLRREGRLIRPEADPEGPGWDAPAFHTDGIAAHLEPTGRNIEREEFAESLVACVNALTEKARTAWYLRAMLEMSSQDIAVHPEVLKSPGHVDVILQRTRASLRNCMRRKGHELTRIPRGAFAVIWERFRNPPLIDQERSFNE